MSDTEEQGNGLAPGGQNGEVKPSASNESSGGPTTEERAAQAAQAAADAATKAAEQVEKAVKKQEKAEKRSKGKGFLSKLSTKAKLIFALVIVAILVIAIAFGPALFARFNKGRYISSSQLVDIVSISKLSTAKFVYNGIADKYDDNGKVEYHVCYDATVSAGIDMTQIRFEIDDKNKTVTPILPGITIDDPVIDETSIEFLPSETGVNLRDVIAICKADASAEVKSAGGVYKVAEQNLQATVEALLMPVLNGTGYSVVWPDETLTSDTASGGANAGQESGEAVAKGGSYENR